jgi:hypothetical protein
MPNCSSARQPADGETRFREALDAYNRALQSDDHDLQVRARPGKVKTALRIAEFEPRAEEGELLRHRPGIPRRLALYADSHLVGRPVSSEA